MSITCVNRDNDKDEDHVDDYNYDKMFECIDDFDSSQSDIVLGFGRVDGMKVSGGLRERFTEKGGGQRRWRDSDSKNSENN